MKTILCEFRCKLGLHRIPAHPLHQISFPKRRRSFSTPVSPGVEKILRALRVSVVNNLSLQNELLDESPRQHKDGDKEENAALHPFVKVGNPFCMKKGLLFALPINPACFHSLAPFNFPLLLEFFHSESWQAAESPGAPINGREEHDHDIGHEPQREAHS